MIIKDRDYVAVKDGHVVIVTGKTHVNKPSGGRLYRNKVRLFKRFPHKYFLNSVKTYEAYVNHNIRMIKWRLNSPFSFPMTDDQITDAAMKAALESLNNIKRQMKTPYAAE